MHDGLKRADFEPALRLVVHRVLAGKVVGEVAPGSARVDDPARGIEHFARIMLPLRCIRGHQGAIGGDEGPFLVADVGGVRFAWFPAMSLPPKVHNAF
ncbi:MAG: hypothetical protein NVSMB52_13830 [Chloroflexota bacterium]